MQQPGDAVKRLLSDARHAIDAKSPQQALQAVVQALQLLHGDNAVLPALRAAAERYHAQQSASIDELSQLLAHVTIAAEQDVPMPQQLVQEQPQWVSQTQQAPQQPFHPTPPNLQPPPQHAAQQLQPHQHMWQPQQQHLGQQQHQQPCGVAAGHPNWESQGHQPQVALDRNTHAAAAAVAGTSRPILEETGRGSFTDAALADGSSWLCPHCSGVVPLQRQQAHLTYWCPGLQKASC